MTPLEDAAERPAVGQLEDTRNGCFEARLRAQHQQALFRGALLGTTSLVALALLTVTPVPSHAADIVWTGANSSTWTDPTNWLPNTLPASPNNAVIDTTSPHATTIAGTAGQATNLYIGQNAIGELTISGGGTMNNVNGFIGNNAGSNGTVTVDGFGSVWFSVGVNVGVAGTGTLTIQNGGTVAGTNGLIGSLPGSSGTATVTGPNSSWNMTDDLSVGTNGTGVLTIKAGGTVSDRNGRVGFVPGSSGTVTVTGPGSSWTNSAELYVGTAGTGTLNIENRGVVSNGADSNAYLGYIFGSNGNVTVDGAGSSLLVGKELHVGYVGTGVLNIQNGGAVSNDTTFIGSNVGSNGNVVVTGAGSSLSSADFLYVGYSGTGTLDIQNGATVTTAPSATRGIAGIGVVAGSNGTVTIDGAGSSWTHGGILNVGGGGTGTLTIRNGAVASMIGSDIGFLAGSKGTATVTGSGSSWTNSFALFVGDAGSGTLTIQNGGIVTTPLFGVANQAGSTGTVNIGAGLGQAAAAPGTLNTPTVTFGAGTGSIVFNHTSANYSFDPAISGAGSVLVEAGKTILTANSTYTGTTTVDGGTLSVNGSIASSSLTSVNAGGTLGGNGTVGNLTIASGGTVAPGNSIGTLNVSGNVSFAAGSIYQVEANAAGQSDRIVATGKATLGGGSVLALAQNGTYAPQTTYTILTANSGVTGSFADVTSSLTFLNPSLTYDPSNVYLTLARNSTTFPDVAQTPNQLAVSNALESSAQTSPLVVSILNQNAAGARQAFDALSGELHASTQTAMLDDSRYLRDAVLGRLRQSAFAGDAGPMAALSVGGPQLAAMDSMAASSALAYAGASRPGFPIKAPPLAAPTRIPDTAFWAQGVGAWGRFGGDGNASGMTRDLAGFFSGVDHRFAPNWIVGIAGGYTNSSLRIGDRTSSANIDTAHLAGYVGATYGALSLRGGAGASFSTLDTSRSIIFPDFFDTTRARYNATSAQVFGEVGYGFNLGKVALEPFAGLAWAHLDTDSFNETGGSAALFGGRSNQDVGYSTVGARFASNLALGNGMWLTPRASVAWQYAFGDVSPTAALAFQSTGASFTVNGVPLARNAALVEGGLDLRITAQATVGISYVGQLADRVQDHSVKGSFSWKF
ncbi:autotransporter outer membrane beta-barrel domain-containing protein [Bradyrhizobium brasilense]|uniref:autotransporter outer membrane beta-barrel domain-containing protein n=1 Tax=Bradyrhizobium brasilense TaxID=1419277 RepID=UPI0015A363C9|nr:autotransporter domain-containing protein [Bradyrhizobium brasilense]